jgi:hypothetical protein
MAQVLSADVRPWVQSPVLEKKLPDNNTEWIRYSLFYWSYSEVDPVDSEGKPLGTCQTYTHKFWNISTPEIWHLVHRKGAMVPKQTYFGFCYPDLCESIIDWGRGDAHTCSPGLDGASSFISHTFPLVACDC